MSYGEGPDTRKQEGVSGVIDKVAPHPAPWSNIHTPFLLSNIQTFTLLRGVMVSLTSGIASVGV